MGRAFRTGGFPSAASQPNPESIRRASWNGPRSLEDVPEPRLVEQVGDGPGEDDGACSWKGLVSPGGVREGRAGPFLRGEGSRDEPARHLRGAADQCDRVHQPDSQGRHLGRAPGPGVDIEILDGEGALASLSPLAQVDRRQDHRPRPPTLGAADHDRLPLERLGPERSDLPAAGRHDPQIAVLPDAADDESRLAQSAGHEPPRLSFPQGQHDVTEGIAPRGEPSQAPGDEVGGGPLPAGDGDDVQEGFGFVGEGGGTGG